VTGITGIHNHAWQFFNIHIFIQLESIQAGNKPYAKIISNGF
jgi:hypothetical protein